MLQNDSNAGRDDMQSSYLYSRCKGLAGTSKTYYLHLHLTIFTQDTSERLWIEVTLICL